jgi:hypothetical protein
MGSSVVKAITVSRDVIFPLGSARKLLSVQISFIQVTTAMVTSPADGLARLGVKVGTVVPV